MDKVTFPKMKKDFDTMGVAYNPSYHEWLVRWVKDEELVWEMVISEKELQKHYPICQACLKWRAILVKMVGAGWRMWECPACGGKTKDKNQMACSCGNIPHDYSCLARDHYNLSGPISMGRQHGKSRLVSEFLGRPWVNERQECILHRKRRLG